MASALDSVAALAETRWKRAVDILWREVVRNRSLKLEERERERVSRRLKNLRKIVRRALAEYHRIEMKRQQSGQTGS